MAKKQREGRGFAILMTVLVILLALAVALFVYGSMTNGIPQPKVPGKGLFALGTMLRHG